MSRKVCIVCRSTAPYQCECLALVYYCGRKHQRVHWEEHRPEHRRRVKIEEVKEGEGEGEEERQLTLEPRKPSVEDVDEEEMFERIELEMLVADLIEGALTAEKARKILHDKEVKGHPLSDRQRRFMGWVAGGRKHPGGGRGGGRRK